MRQIAKALIAAAALGVAVWFGLPAFTGEKPSAIIAAITGKAADVIPDSPEEWSGEIDYDELDRQLAEMSSRPEMAGLAVAVVENGELSFVRTYGVVDKSTGVAVTPLTVFRWASVSKTVTGALAATLANEGAADLDQPVADWQTSLRLPEGAESQVTLGQLLSQQTGLTKNAYDEKLEEGQSPGIIRSRLVNAPLQCQPGTCHTYQNVAFDAASEILSQAAGRSFPDVASERLFLPLGMTSATYGMEGLTGSKEWARPHDVRQVRTLRETYWRVPAAAGVNSNIVDFARWMQATMGEREDVLPTAILSLAQAPRVATQNLYGGELRQANSEAKYGLGWRSFVYAGHHLVGHSGAVDGFRASMIFEPEARTGVVVMWNSNWGRPFRIPFAVIDSYYKRVDSRWLDLGDVPLPAQDPNLIE
ncbi:serine hydrolase domain-containing protein [Sphingorhabdus sp.]|uniref:serine hydrolase domain-containing protein n=1 Tax=Sphingorhabdus sp. TaxID=1902408 RepID=UPI0035933421